MKSYPSSPFQLKPSSILLLAGTIMALTIAAAFYGLSVKQDAMIQSQIEIAARKYFESIVLTRRWNAEYGGVYVAKKEGMASNPYLKDPDIVTRDGAVYTMKNPALMTREISELARSNGGYQYHITSLKLMNPANAPDEWERHSLEKFESGATETSLLTEINGKKIFRLMRPLHFEASCAECHGEQGYVPGDVRGAISVALPYDDIAAALKSNRTQILTLALLVLACFLALFYLGPWQLLGRLTKTNSLLAAEKEKLRLLTTTLKRKVEERNEELLTANDKLRQESKGHQETNLSLRQQVDFKQALLEALPFPVFYKDTTGTYLGCNSHFAEFLGRPKQEIVGKTVFDIVPKELADTCRAQDESVFRQPGVHVYGKKVQNAQGEEREILFHKAAFNQSGGDLGGLIGTLVDITTQKQAEEELLRHRHHLEKLVDERTKGLEKTQTALQYLLEDMSEAQKELEAKVTEIERMNKFFVNRELRMVELKEKIKNLEEKIIDQGGCP